MVSLPPNPSPLLHLIARTRTHRVNGGDLYKRLLDRGAFPEQAAKKLFLQLLVGVSYLHSRNIAHRDLKVCSSVPLFCVCLS